MNKQPVTQLPLPPFYSPKKADDWRWKPSYASLTDEAVAWAKKHGINPAAADAIKVCLLLIDPQNTFGHPDFELFVAGLSGRGALDDSNRTAEFIYRYMAILTKVAHTMDTHYAMQIFHPIFWVDDNGNHPSGGTMIEPKDIASGKWKVNPAIIYSLSQKGKISYNALRIHAEYYVSEVTKRYPVIVWPYHAILGGYGHAIVPTIHEAAWFHQMARDSEIHIEVKGENPLTENYSVLRPEVLVGANKQPIGAINASFFKMLLGYDMILIAGQAKSHCMAWSISDLLDMINNPQLGGDPSLAKKIYLLEDCTSNVVVPQYGLDFTKQGDDAYASFKKRGVNIVQSVDPIWNWPNSPFQKA